MQDQALVFISQSLTTEDTKKEFDNLPAISMKTVPLTKGDYLGKLEGMCY